MGRKRQPDRVVCIEDRGGTGPRRFRLHVVAGGRRVARGFPSLAEATDAASKYEAKTAPLRTDRVRDLIERYRDDMLARGLWQDNAKALTRKVPRLTAFLGPVLDMPIGLVTPAGIAQCCRAWDTTGRAAYNTRQDGRIKAKAFFRWCARQRLIRTVPISEDHFLRTQRPAKDRLRIDDARRLRAQIDPAALAGDVTAAWVLTCLLLGPRSSELLYATVDSLDDAGRVLRYRDAKDKVTHHEVRLPPVLAEVMSVLATQARERGDGMLFGAGRSPKWPARWVRRWCQLAGIQGWEHVDTRWLRRTKDTIAVESGLAAEAVARETGHTLHVARLHYVGDGAETAGRAAALDVATAPGISTSAQRRGDAQAGTDTGGRHRR